MKKAIYVDGHERADVVESRKQFIEDYNELYKFCRNLDDETLEEKPNPNAKYNLTSMDEKIFHSNDVQTRRGMIVISQAIIRLM